MYPQILSSTTWGFSTSLTQISFSEAHNFEELACCLKKNPFIIVYVYGTWQKCYFKKSKEIYISMLEKIILQNWLSYFDKFYSVERQNSTFAT